jgi:isopentenyl-diphosphate delta-isomerase
MEKRGDEKVVLVDESDREIGTMEKLEAHRQGRLHRAFSVFIFNSVGEMLLQKRAESKYHSPGLLTNACCSHQRPGESNEAAASRRLFEEMGLRTDLKKKGSFIYRSVFENGLTEHEFDHIFEGSTDKVPAPDEQEVQDFCWMPLGEIKKEINENPERFTTWFRIAMEKIY